MHGWFPDGIGGWLVMIAMIVTAIGLMVITHERDPRPRKSKP